MKDQSIIPLSIFNSIVKGFITALAFFLGIYLVEINFSGIQIGIIFAISAISRLLTILPSGISNDTRKSKNLIAISLIFLALSYLGLSIYTTFLSVALLFFLQGLGTTLYIASSESLFYKLTNREDIGNKIGIFQGLNYILIAAGMVASGYFLQAGVSFHTIFISIAAAFGLMAIISLIILPKNQTTKLEIAHYQKDILRPKVLIFMLILFLFAIHFGAESTSYGLFLEKHLELTKLQIGLYMGTAIFIMGPTAIFIGYKLKQFKAKNILIFGLLFSGLGHILMTINQPTISFAFRVLHEIGDTGIFFFMYYGIKQLFDMERIGGNSSTFSLVMTIGASLGALIFGPMGSAYGYNIPLIVGGGISLIALGLTLFYTKHFDH